MDYLQFDKIMKDGRLRRIEVDPARIMGIIGGPVRRGQPLTFQLELTTRAQRRTLVPCAGDTSELRDQFNRLGPKDFMFFDGVFNPLPNLRREKLQPSAVRIGRIAVIEPNQPHRKAHSIIKRTGLPEVLATETVADLARLIMDQGFRGNGLPDPARFILHPDHQQAAPVPPKPLRRQKLPNPFNPTGQLF